MEKKWDTVIPADLKRLFVTAYAALHTVLFATRLFRGKMHSDWFNGTDTLQGRWQHGEKVGYCYPSGLGNSLCKWEMYVPLVTKGLNPYRTKCCGINKCTGFKAGHCI
jgi:hypothetical protein